MGTAVLLGLLLFRQAGAWLVTADPPQPVDAIVILGGEGRNSLRTRHALDLYAAGAAPRVVFSGGTIQSAGLACSSAQMSLDAARQLGLPPGVALIAPEAQSTYDEAVNLASLAESEGWQRLLLVTAPYHTRRAARTFRALLPDRTVLVAAAPDPDFHPERWWDEEESLLAVVQELLKLSFYWRQYGIAPFG